MAAREIASLKISTDVYRGTYARHHGQNFGAFECSPWGIYPSPVPEQSSGCAVVWTDYSPEAILACAAYVRCEAYWFAGLDHRQETATRTMMNFLHLGRYVSSALVEVRGFFARREQEPRVNDWPDC